MTNLSNNRADMMHTQLSSFAISLNANMSIGRVTSSVSGVPLFSGTTDYTHDTKFELTQESSTRGGSYTNTNAFDNAGNPTTFKGVTQTFNSANQNNTAGAGYAYDSNGNPTSYKGNTLSFDVENRLTAYGTLMTAGYRSDGQRAWKQNSSGTTYYFYDGDKLLYETNSTGTITAKNTWGDTGLLARSTSTRTLLYSWDAQGNVCQQLDASTGNVVESYMFDAFGTRGTNGSDTAAMAEPYAGFGGNAGYYTDSETGLQLCGHRYLDPTTGRFLTRDPISYAGGINLYECVGNSPLGMHDASGLAERIGLGPGAQKGGGDGLLECVANFIAVYIQHRFQSKPCMSMQVCQMMGGCLVDLAAMILCRALLGLCPIAEVAAGCICGAVEGIAHYLVDYTCGHFYGCGEEKDEPIDWGCLIMSGIAGLIEGCFGGLFGMAADGITDMLEKMFLKMIGIGGAIGVSSTGDLATDGICKSSKPFRTF